MLGDLPDFKAVTEVRADSAVPTREVTVSASRCRKESDTEYILKLQLQHFPGRLHVRKERNQG